MIGRDASVARIENVTQRYGKMVALDAVTIDLPAGCMVGLIGPDGVGKSSLLSMIAGARQIQSGRVVVLDGDMADSAHRAAICPRIAYMPQGLGKNLYADLSVRENIEFFGRLVRTVSFRAECERISELLDSTGLAPFADRPAKKLSGGMRQKLGLCCCLIHDPDLLILDEPTTGVDPLSRRQFWELIDRMRSRRQGMSVVVATAYMEEAERFDWLGGHERREGPGHRIPGRPQGRRPAPRRSRTRSSRCFRNSSAAVTRTANTAASHHRRRPRHSSPAISLAVSATSPPSTG